MYGMILRRDSGACIRYMSVIDIPVWERCTLTIEEASRYFRIGEDKLRRLAEDSKNAKWLIMNGNRIQIKRKQFEKIMMN